jgi:hypothetical protein
MKNKDHKATIDINSTEVEKKEEKLIGRKEAIKKAGLIALSAATMMLLVGKPDKAVAQSPDTPPVWPGGF